MSLHAGKDLQVNVIQIPRSGAPWVVRTYKKSLFFRRLISSDWFLTEGQARRFAEQVVKGAAERDPIPLLHSRKPGWIYNRAAR